MKKAISRLAKLSSLVLLTILAFSGAVQAQSGATSGKLNIEGLDQLTAKASEVVNVNLDEHLLRIVPKALSKSSDDKKVADIIAGLKGVYVKSLEFEDEGAYSRSNVDSIRRQLRSPGWSKIVDVISRRDREDIEVYILTNGDHVEGLAIIAFEAKRLTVVNIVGTVDLEKLSRLEGQFGIPDFEIEEKPGSQKK